MTRTLRYLVAVVLLAAAACGPTHGDVATYIRRNNQLFRDIRIEGARLTGEHSDRYGTRGTWGVRTTRVLSLKSSNEINELARNAQIQLEQHGWLCSPLDSLIADAGVDCGRRRATLAVSFEERGVGRWRVEMTADWNDRVRNFDD